ncbi:uncharacterized protein HMPREF1541_03785 [Cyphellophora europaea CBS 101466]|uniref:EGF domain-specific O-linked N-acetylglucosamine transferase n=1 Tax=Cyphellophora europaea (strain CBS 101466) TaxID=1220924 RepID=W2RZC6_CYPE1|nr:uncharacterized protein HMPREF1541_03785 [Cyphellophora europaea CBS 101466]ETN41846.1 hypothetical protein HMPREF1541_03785 [Cyphellophora europaea CBS 101466]
MVDIATSSSFRSIGKPSYIESFADSAAQYCDADSSASLTCFSHTVDLNGRTDSFCVASPATIDQELQRFVVDCSLESQPKTQHGLPAPSFHSFPPYWYNTGPAKVLKMMVSLVRRGQAPVRAPFFDQQLPTVILVKREIANFNLWHNLMEIMSTMHSLDVISRWQDVADWRVDRVHANTKVMILDELEDGPYHDLWHAITPSPVLRSKDILTLPPSNIVISIPGGANPFWQGDWIDLDCSSSSLLETFTDRVLTHFNLTAASTALSQPLTVTFIDRTTKRRLQDQARLIDTLKTRLPGHVIQVVDFAALPFRDQINVARKTDVLVGVHGAGLTHGLFLPPKSAIVEFMPFNLDHRGFKNMAKMLGHQHLGAKTQDLSDRQGSNRHNDWQSEDVKVEDETFLHQVTTAVKAVEAMRRQGTK